MRPRLLSFPKQKVCSEQEACNQFGNIKWKDNRNISDEANRNRLESSTRREAFKSETHFDHWDIKQQAIQLLHTDVAENQSTADQRANSKWLFFQKTLHPNGNFRRIFDMVTVVWVLILAFTIPFEIGFSWYFMPKSYKTFSSLLDCWFVLDIVLNFRTGYILHGTVVMDDAKITRHYLSTWFAIDLLGTIPFELLLNGRPSSRKSLKLVKYFKIPKLMRLSRILKYLHEHKQVYDIFEVFIFVLSFLHFGSCIWARILDPCPTGDFHQEPNHVCSQDNILNAYAQVLHISAVMILGISNNHIMNADNIDIMRRSMESTNSQSLILLMSTMFMVGGLFLVALLISKMNVYVMGKMQGSAAFQQRNDRVKHEMEYYGVPDELQKQVKTFYNYVWVHQRQYDDRIALLSDEQMSTDLQRKLALHLYKDVVSHISLFSEIDDLMLGEICLSLRTRIFLPKDMILFKGDVGRELFIISKGIVEVIRDDLPPSQRYPSPPILLRKGSFFGEIALIMETRRTCSVEARTMCEVNVLHQDTFDTILSNHPAFARRMNELVVARSAESCLERAKSEGINMTIAKSDMDKAVTVVEQNMYEGLKRRSKLTKDYERNIDNSMFGAISNKYCLEENIEKEELTSAFNKSSVTLSKDLKSTSGSLCNKDKFDNVTPPKSHQPSLSNIKSRKIHENQRCDDKASRFDIEEGESDQYTAVGHFSLGQKIQIEKIRKSVLDPPKDSPSSLNDEIIRTILSKDALANKSVSGLSTSVDNEN